MHLFVQKTQDHNNRFFAAEEFTVLEKDFLFLTNGKSHQNPHWTAKQIPPERKISHCWQISNMYITAEFRSQSTKLWDSSLFHKQSC